MTGAIKLPQGVEMVMPGDNVNIDVELITPIAIEQGLRFAIREGGHTVGAGVDHRGPQANRRWPSSASASGSRRTTTSCSTSPPQQIVETAQRTGAVVAGPVPLPTRIEKYTVIRGPFVAQGLAGSSSRSGRTSG